VRPCQHHALLYQWQMAARQLLTLQALLPAQRLGCGAHQAGSSQRPPCRHSRTSRSLRDLVHAPCRRQMTLPRQLPPAAPRSCSRWLWWAVRRHPLSSGRWQRRRGWAGTLKSVLPPPQAQAQTRLLPRLLLLPLLQLRGLPPKP
jgi:hypothetical protein